MSGPASSSVPCGSCTLCCHKQRVWMLPGDDAGLDWIPGTNPQGKTGLRLRTTVDGACVHLGSGGCTVYDTRPRLCRLFDCREHYHKPAAERRKIEAQVGAHDLAIFRRGRQLVEEQT